MTDRVATHLDIFTGQIFNPADGCTPSGFQIDASLRHVRVGYFPHPRYLHAHLKDNIWTITGKHGEYSTYILSDWQIAQRVAVRLTQSF